jgi:NAD(P)-dependent dehydrogenase (short-subunit alcohol dehydrogenase family)
MTPRAWATVNPRGATMLDNVPGFKETVMQKLMLKRLGRPEDIGWCATFLASDESSWVTAADFRIDGGATAW